MQNEKFDWAHFTYLAQQHRVVTSIYPQLNALSETIKKQTHNHMGTFVKQIPMRQLLLSGELVQINRLLKSGNISCITLKGIAQSLLINDHNYTRYPGNDIDIWVQEEDLSAAFKRLTKLGYERTTHNHELTPKQWQHFKTMFYDEHFWHPEKKIHIELHWRLDNLSKDLCNPDFEEGWSRKQTVSLAGEKIHALGLMDNLHYLSYHAAKHGWHRLFWLLDIVKTLQKLTPEQWDTLTKHTQSSSCQRPMLQAISMANTLFQTPIPESLEKKLAQWQIKHSVNNAFYNMSCACEQTPRIYKNFLARWVTLPNLLFKWRLINTPLMDRRDWQLVKLPDSFFFIYYIIRPFTWSLRKLGLIADG